MTKNGANLIIGYHPSVIQPVSIVKSKRKRSLVFWSLGHFVSDSKKKFSFLGAIANITICKRKKKAYISEYNMIPIINHKEEGKHYSIYKLSQYSELLFNKSKLNVTNLTRKDIIAKCEKLIGGFADCY